MFNKETYIARREQLRKDLKSGIVILPGNHEAPCNYKDNTYWFRQDSTFLYFFGLQREDLVGVIDCDSGKDYLFANDYDIDDIIWTGPLPSVKELAASVGVDNSGSLADLRKYLDGKRPTSALPHYLPPYRADIRADLSEWLGVPYAAVNRHASLDLILACVKQRSIKSPEEIAEIERAIATAYNMHVGAMRLAMPGRYEYELAGFMEGEAWKGNGPVSFPVIMTVHGETLHNHGHNNRLEKGRMLVMDAGCETPMAASTNARKPSTKSSSPPTSKPYASPVPASPTRKSTRPPAASSPKATKASASSAATPTTSSLQVPTASSCPTVSAT